MAPSILRLEKSLSNNIFDKKMLFFKLFSSFKIMGAIKNINIDFLNFLGG